MSKKATGKKDVIFQAMINYLEGRFSQLPDQRVGDNKFIAMKDIGLSAFSVFFTQSSSFLEHQRLMSKRQGKCNADSLFNIDYIPSDNHIRNLLDPVLPSEVFSVFDYALNRVKDAGILDEFRWLSDQLLIAMDGVYYFSSKQLSCDKCSQKHHHDGSISYSHSMVSATIVNPKSSTVLPLKPEFIEPQDGHIKQDCEGAGIKRWLKVQGSPYASLNATLLGDDLYACQPVCEAVLDSKYHFIFTCKKESHKCLYEWIDSLKKDDGLNFVEEKIKEKNKSYRYCCSYVNQVPIRDGKDALDVNWCSVTVYDQNNKQVYSGGFITDHCISDTNVVDIIRAGRTRWKTENEHNNTLKNHGYQLAHNFGHGKQHLSSLLATLILLSFLFHEILMLLDARYKAVRGYLPRKMFFQQLRTILFYMYFATWDALMECMVQACEVEVCNTS